MAGKVLRNPKRGHCLAPMLTPAQVAEIRLSDELPWAYAKRHGLPPAVVYNAAHGLSWKAMRDPAPRAQTGCLRARKPIVPTNFRENDGTEHGGRVAWWEIEQVLEAALDGAFPRREARETD